MIRLAAALGVTVFLLLAALFLPGGALLPASSGATALAAPPPTVSKPAPPPVQLPPPVGQVLEKGVLIVVSKPLRRMYVFKDGALWATSPVSTGKRGHATPVGVFPILQKRRFHRSNIYSNAPMPYMQRLTWSGIAIHAGHVPAYDASHGCIRLPHAFARSLFALTRSEATTVVVTGTAVRSDQAAISLALNMPVPGKEKAPALAAATAPSPLRIDPAPLVPVQPVRASGGQTIQLAAAQSQGEADALWADLTNRHPQLLGTQHVVIPAVVGSRRVFRLRTTAPGAHALCSTLKRSGTACFNVS